jgi:hypothetical protein
LTLAGWIPTEDKGSACIRAKKPCGQQIIRWNIGQKLAGFHRRRQSRVDGGMLADFFSKELKTWKSQRLCTFSEVPPLGPFCHYQRTSQNNRSRFLQLCTEKDRSAEE